MTWVRIDDGFASHPKVTMAGPLAMILQIAALCYCNKNLTDGFVPWAVARTLVTWQFLEPPDVKGRRRVSTLAVTSGIRGDDVEAEYVIRLLLETGMWEEVDGGYRIHDFEDYQPVKAQVLAEKETKRRAGQAGGIASAVARATADAIAKSKPVPGSPPLPCAPAPAGAAAATSDSVGPISSIDLIQETAKDFARTNQRAREAAAAALPKLISGHENLIGVLNEASCRILEDWAERIPESAEWAIEYAFKEAALSNRRNLRYVTSILARLESGGWPVDNGPPKQELNSPAEGFRERRHREHKARNEANDIGSLADARAKAHQEKAAKL